MAPTNLEVVERIYDGWSRGDFTVEGDRLDPHATVVVRRDFPAFGVFVGPEQISAYLRDFMEQWERMRMTAEELQEVGDTVLARVHQRAEGRASGLEAELRFFMLWTLRGGKIIRIDTIMHEAEALEAAGLMRPDRGG